MSFKSLTNKELKKTIRERYNLFNTTNPFKFIACFNFMYKTKLRNLFKGYYNYRYLNSTGGLNFGKYFQFSVDEYTKQPKALSFYDSKIQELFELADKSKFLGASLLSVSINELNIIDSYKENYPFTVIINK
jgi:hypothetical protein